MRERVQRIARNEADAVELRETLSELFVANEVGRRKTGGKTKAGALSRAIGEAINNARDAGEITRLGKLRAFVNAIKTHFKALFGTMKALREARTAGATGQLDALMDKLNEITGQDEQVKHDRERMAETEAIAKEAGIDYTAPSAEDEANGVAFSLSTGDDSGHGKNVFGFRRADSNSGSGGQGGSGQDDTRGKTRPVSPQRFLGEWLAAGGHGPGTSAEAQEASLVEFAKSKGLARTGAYLKKLAPNQGDGGQEHEVFMVGDRVIKVNFAGVYGPSEAQTPRSYLERMANLDRITGDVRIDVEAIIPGSKSQPIPRIVTSMAFIEGPHPKTEALERYLQESGWVKGRGYLEWAHQEGALMADAHPANFIDTGLGMVPIDVAFDGPVFAPESTVAFSLSPASVLTVLQNRIDAAMARDPD